MWFVKVDIKLNPPISCHCGPPLVRRLISFIFYNVVISISSTWPSLQVFFNQVHLSSQPTIVSSQPTIILSQLVESAKACHLSVSSVLSKWLSLWTWISQTTHAHKFGKIVESGCKEGLVKYLCFTRLYSLSLEKLSCCLIGIIHK